MTENERGSNAVTEAASAPSRVCGGFEADITRIANEVLSDGTVEAILRDKIAEGFKSAIESSFRFGDLRIAIERRVRDVLVPYVERYDMGAYVAKLDETLGQIVERTVLVDNKTMLENFKRLMVEPTGRSITLEALFERYCEHVADHVDTFDLEVLTDDGPSYEPVCARAEVVRIDRETLRRSSFEHAVLNLSVEEDKDDDLAFSVRLSRWKKDGEDGFTINYDAEPSIPALAHMSDFEVLLSTLSRARVNLVWDAGDLEERVVPSKEPECDCI